MEYIIGAIGLIFSLFLAGFLLKKQHYKKVDQLEAWKIDIMNRPVLDEMSKVKQLNMTGQTEELFERWRKEWDEIVTSELPNIEEYLFDAEEYIDKYRFNKAKEIQSKIKYTLNETEARIQKILNELNELVGSEERNRKEIDELKNSYREIKKNLLAHRHIFGKAEIRLELLLDDVLLKFAEFDEKTENGNYLEAREIVLMIEDYLNKIKYKQEWIPRLLHECQSSLPAQIAELKEGFTDMVNHNYVLNHIPVNEEIERMEKQLEVFLDSIEKTEVDEVFHGIEEMKGNIELLLDLLEKEVLAKHHINHNGVGAKDLLHSAIAENDKLKEELKVIQQIYHLSDAELEAQRNTEKHLLQLAKRFEILFGRINEQQAASTLLSDELTEVTNLLKEIIEQQKAFTEKLHTLRKDEMSGREKVRELIKKVSDTTRLVSKSNIPGLPQDYRYLMDDSKEAIRNVTAKLEEKPLDISAVHQYLDVAVLTVEKLVQTTEDMLESVMLAEKVIQYGNRYRSSHPSVAKALKQAEDAFRGYNYREALEQAATSIEEIEPGALKRVEAILSEE